MLYRCIEKFTHIFSVFWTFLSYSRNKKDDKTFNFFIIIINFTFTLSQVLEAFARAEKRLKPNWKEMFTEVYDEMPVDLKKQMNEMEKHVNLYKDQYPLKNYAK